jgi:hypothetical protein
MTLLEETHRAIEVADLLLDVRMVLSTTELPVSELDAAGAAAN